MLRTGIVTALATLALAGCQSTVQTSSGQAYLSAYESGAGTSQVDREVREAAAVEPQLRFPARIGLARITSDGYSRTTGLSVVPAEEAAAWAGVAQALGSSFGEFVPISPLVAEMVAPVDPQTAGTTASIVRGIRLAAARQHVDAVLIYETFGTAKSEGNILSIADLTIIGAYVLPNRDVEAQGYAQALLIDVRNGYPYAQFQTTAADTALSASANADVARDDLSDDVRREALRKLIAEAEPTMRTLRAELDAARANKPAAR